jgi:hypothetical protein
VGKNMSSKRLFCLVNQHVNLDINNKNEAVLDSPIFLFTFINSTFTNYLHYTCFLKEIHRRRTFGIISHPDAGKTTLTEKLPFGGAIQEAGAKNNKIKKKSHE